MSVPTSPSCLTTSTFLLNVVGALALGLLAMYVLIPGMHDALQGFKQATYRVVRPSATISGEVVVETYQRPPQTPATQGIALTRAMAITEFCASRAPLLDAITWPKDSDRSVPRAVALMRLQSLSFASPGTVPTRVVDFVTRSIETLYANPAARMDFWDGCHAAWN